MQHCNLAVRRIILATAFVPLLIFAAPVVADTPYGSGDYNGSSVDYNGSNSSTPASATPTSSSANTTPSSTSASNTASNPTSTNQTPENTTNNTNTNNSSSTGPLSSTYEPSNKPSNKRLYWIVGLAVLIIIGAGIAVLPFIIRRRQAANLPWNSDQ
jgi:hypothetical protein